MARKKKVEETPEGIEPSFLIEEEIKFEKLEHVHDPNEDWSNVEIEETPKRSARVILILKHKNEIIVEILSNQTGERIKYDPVMHETLKAGDIIEI